MIVVDNTSLFVAIAREAGQDASVAYERADHLLILVAQDADYAVECGRAFELAGRRALTTVVFAAIAVEAFINNFAAERLSATKFKKYYDKLDVIAKWVVVPKIAGGFSVAEGGIAFQGLTELITARNRFVHSKRESYRIEDFRDMVGKKHRYREDARKAIEALDALAREIGEPYGARLRLARAPGGTDTRSQ